jgi:hypothetical protein
LLNDFNVSEMKVNLKKTMVVLILAALTLSGFSILLGPGVKAETSDVKVLSYSWYVAPINTVLAAYTGDLVAVGEVQNVGSNVLGSVFVVGTAYNSTGRILASEEAQAYVYDLLPGQKAPFYIDFIPQNSVTQDQSWVPSVSNVTVSVVYASETNAAQYSGLTSAGVKASDVDGAYTVTGTVQNNGSETVGYVWVDTTFYNSSGSVVGFNYTNYLVDSFAPGQSVPFTVTPTDNSEELSSEITSYSLLIQSEPLTTSASPTPSASTYSSLEPTATPTSSLSGKYSGSLDLIYAVIVIVVIVVVAAMALVFLRKSHNLPPPPPQPPSPAL